MLIADLKPPRLLFLFLSMILGSAQPSFPRTAPKMGATTRVFFEAQHGLKGDLCGSQDTRMDPGQKGGWGVNLLSSLTESDAGFLLVGSWTREGSFRCLVLIPGGQQWDNLFGPSSLPVCVTYDMIKGKQSC